MIKRAIKVTFLWTWHCIKCWSRVAKYFIKDTVAMIKGEGQTQGFFCRICGCQYPPKKENKNKEDEEKQQ